MSFLIIAHSVTGHTSSQFIGMRNSLGMGGRLWLTLHIYHQVIQLPGNLWSCLCSDLLNRLFVIICDLTTFIKNNDCMILLWLRPDWPDFAFWSSLRPTFWNVESGWCYFNSEYRKRNADGFSKFSLILCYSTQLQRCYIFCLELSDNIQFYFSEELNFNQERKNALGE